MIDDNVMAISTDGVATGQVLEDGAQVMAFSVHIELPIRTLVGVRYLGFKDGRWQRLDYDQCPNCVAATAT